MKKVILALTIFSFEVHAVNTGYFQRPLNCPLRFSQLTNLRDQMQVLVSSLGNGCSQQTINQLNTNVSNLEGIVTTFNDYADKDKVTQTAQYAKNVGQILNGINLITSNNACFYDIRSRGFLPVLSDVIMSTSQLGLLIPSGTGAAVAAGGYLAGSGIKIINELVKKKFNFDKPDERRAFMQLNCAFFDNRRLMDESGIFNPDTEEFRDELISELRKERINLIKSQKKNDQTILELESDLSSAINNIPYAKDRGLDPVLSRKFEEIITALSKRPGDYSEKLRQVSLLSEKIKDVLVATKNLRLDSKTETSRKILVTNLEKISMVLEPNASAWVNNIDDYEMNIRGPLMAFLVPVADSLKKELMTIEAELVDIDPLMAKKISKLRIEIKEYQTSAWSVVLRQASIESKIASLEKAHSNNLFSESDEGSSNAVEILDFYRKLQSSILGKEGRDYLKNALKTGIHMKDGLDLQLELLTNAGTQKEKCAVAEKIRFAWVHYKFKVQEAHDFVATNMDLYRSSFRIGKERRKRSTTYVLKQMDSVREFVEDRTPQGKTVGALMFDVSNRVNEVESKIRSTGCF